MHQPTYSQAKRKVKSRCRVHPLAGYNVVKVKSGSLGDGGGAPKGGNVGKSQNWMSGCTQNGEILLNVKDRKCILHHADKQQWRSDRKNSKDLYLVLLVLYYSSPSD